MTTTNPMSYGVFPSFNNKTPKEGPRYIPMTFDFSTVDTWDVDLMQIQQQGKISTLQAFYVDNSLNTVELIITMGLGGQVIKVQPGYQGFITALVNNVPKFSVSSAGGVSAIVFALNFPVVNALWPASPNATAGEAVTVTNFPASYPITAASAIPVTVGNFPATQPVSIAGPLGSALSSASIPVVIATDQSAIASNITSIGGSGITTGLSVAAHAMPVCMATNQPAGFYTIPSQNVVVTTTSSNVVLPAGAGSLNLRISNIGASNIYFRLGTSAQTAVIGDVVVSAGKSITLYCNNSTNIAFIGEAAGLANITYVTGLSY